MAPKDERGSTSLIAIAVCFVLLVTLGFTFDVASALDVKAGYGNDLAAARDDTMSASFQMMAKNAEKPGRMVADEAAASLRANGYSGEITVYFYEADASQVPRGKRAYAWGVGCAGFAPALYSQLYNGGAGWHVSESVCAHAVPYSAGTAWRPTDSGSGMYVYAAGADVGEPQYTRMASADELPAAMKDELASAIAEAKQGKE